MRDEHGNFSNDGEIDLFEIFRFFWEQKYLILSITFVVSAFTIAYVLLATPIYQASIIVEPPSQNEVAPLNLGRDEAADLPPLTTKNIFDVYLRSLNSEFLRRTFFHTVYLPAQGVRLNESVGELYTKFNKILLVIPVGSEESPRFAITAENINPRDAVDWVTRYAKMAGIHAMESLIKDLESDASVRAGNLEREIASARVNAKRRREDEIARLNEALAISRAVGLENPLLINKGGSGDSSLLMEGELAYLRGSKALEAEIDILKNRPSDDPYIEGLRKRQGEVAFYSGLKIDVTSAAVYRQDGVVETPDKPLKPKRFLIILLGLVLGGVTGIICAFFRSGSHDAE